MNDPSIERVVSWVIENTMRLPDGRRLTRSQFAADRALAFTDEPCRYDDHTVEDCTARFTNLDRFSGFPEIPALAEELGAIYESGIREALRVLGFETGEETTNEARARIGLPPVENGGEIPAIVNQVNERSVAWAQEHAAELVTQIEPNTRAMLRATIVESIEQGWGANKLADEIAESAGFSDEHGNLDTYKKSGVVEKKEWLDRGRQQRARPRITIHEPSGERSSAALPPGTTRSAAICPARP
jgi:hypothetical protein